MTQTLIEFVRPTIGGSRRDLCLAAMYFLRENQGVERCSSSELKGALIAARVPGAKAFNVADTLGRAGHLVVADKTAAKVNMWRLTRSGDVEVREKLGILQGALEVKNDISLMDKLVAAVSDDVVKGYLEESILAYSVGALRASVVFLWSGAIRHLQERALAIGVTPLNAALVKHDPRARRVGKVEDYSGVKDVVQLLGFREIGLIDKGEWATLQEGLDLRNRCGHPTKYKPGVKKVSAFIEDIATIVF